MEAHVGKEGVFEVLKIFAEENFEGEMFEDFWEPTKPCVVEFKHDPAFSYPHIEIRKEVL